MSQSREEEEAAERRGKCENCGGRGPMFQLPTSQLFCAECTSTYISWELDGGRESDPETYAWLWEARVAFPAKPYPGHGAS